MLERASCLHLSGLQVGRKGGLLLGTLCKAGHPAPQAVSPKAGKFQLWQKGHPAGSFWWQQALRIRFKPDFNCNGSVKF